jgi:hypothetical protein
MTAESRQDMRRHVTDVAPTTDTDEECGVVHAWRVRQLTRIGLASLVAEAVADKVDWHEIARLVQRGCPAALAVIIVQ